ncbi:unnamed protein product [Brachionus calyciflorus]|uniref:LIM zinc-binding domain-containing protein n=1 Tax=Brachionus calyciflorus TaxID=104777 RepID=A0A813ZL23_9BILA|nr:unnamed protein product [Brachionus calyciflorus]
MNTIGDLGKHLNEPFTDNSLLKCNFCLKNFDHNQQIINAKGETFHSHCFVCAQCFQPFEDGIYYEVIYS